MQCLEIAIKDIPPSNNKYMGNSHNFNAYRKEKERWHWLIKAELSKVKKPQRPIEKAVVSIRYYFPTRGRRDPDNYSGKMLLDPLVREGVLIDDSFKAVTLVLSAGYDKKNSRTVINVKEVEDE